MQGLVAPMRVAEIAEGQTLVVRKATVDDVDAITALYAGLTPDDLYRRFFCGSRPPRALIERWVAMHGDTGVMLVAEVRDPGRGGELVGEAVWTALPDGSAEFSLTVARSWRGWLGPYLLDTLVEAAAGQGIASLQADVLSDNRQMLAVVRARGYVMLDHSDWSIVRVMIATGRGVPPWPPKDPRTRVLVEGSGARSLAAALAAKPGLRVIGCGGPARTPDGWCPALRGEACPLADGADLVVSRLPTDDDRTAAVLAAHRAHDIPVRTELPLQPAAAAESVLAQLARAGCGCVLDCPTSTGPWSLALPGQRS